MCGICGVFNYAQSDFALNEELLRQMCRRMAHRGPDDEGVYLDRGQGIGLGHRRLSIVDLSAAGHQPMSNEDGSVWIVFNGEIYNHLTLRRGLEATGHRFHSQSDTEVIIHLYEEKESECLPELEGMFAFCIWDSRKQQILLARDRIGIKPLYYAVRKGSLCFASEIKVLWECPFLSPELDPQALYHYLSFITVPAPLTMFKGVSKLKPGSYQIWSRSGCREGVYWEPSCSYGGEQPEEYYVESLRELLSASIEKRMMSDVPFGVFLSGGVDSSLNVALMSRLMQRPVDTFSVGFAEQQGYDESRYIQQIVQKFGTNHHQVLLDQHSFLDLFPKLAYQQDEPLADPVCVPLYYVSQLARKSGTIVIQVGEGSDELFFGYNSFADILRLYQRYWRPFTALPGWLRKLGYGASSPFLDLERRDIVRRAALGKGLFWGGALAFWELEKSRLLAPGFKERLGNISSWQQVAGYLQPTSSKEDFMQQMMRLEFKIRLPELLLMRIDKMAMANSVEVRVPFLDHKLVEFALQIPPRFKYRQGVGKYILKKACRGILPDEIIYRPKLGFCGSSANMLTPPLLAYARKLLLDSELSREILDRGYVERLLKNQESGVKGLSLRVWNLLNLGLWYNTWISKESV